MSSPNTPRLLILGATGRTGQHLVERALAQGHHVRAFVRQPKKLAVTHPALEVVQGDVLDATAVGLAVQGCEAVLSVLGRDGKDVRPLLEGTRHLVVAMKQGSVQRLVCLSSMGAGSTASLAGPGLNLMIGLMGLRHSFDAKAMQERWLFDSGLEVSVMFAGSLTDGAATGAPLVCEVAAAPRARLLPPRSVSRADVAVAMLAELQARRWVGRPCCVVSA